MGNETMKTVVLLFVMLISLTCHGQTHEDSLSTYVEQARWGDGEAYLKLADYYSRDADVERGLLMANVMVSWARLYGAIDSEESYFERFPKDSPFFQLNTLMSDMNNGRLEDCLVRAETLPNKNIQEIVKALVFRGQGKVDEASGMLKKCANRGSLLARILLLGNEEDLAEMEDLAKDLPWIYNQLVRASVHTDNNNAYEDSVIVAYYRKADAHACLDDIGIRWLLSYDEERQKNGAEKVDVVEMKRLRKLSEMIKY